MFNFESLITGEGQGVFNRATIDLVNPQAVGGWDPGLLRPYLGEDGRSYVDVTVNWEPRKDASGNIVRNSSGDPIMRRVTEPQLVANRLAQGQPVLPVNNATTLTKDAWVRIDATVAKAARARLRAWADLRAANTFGGFDGMSTPMLEYEAMTDPGEAKADMEGLAEGRNFAPQFGRFGLPLPITHSDFHLAERFLAASRRSGQPQDLLRAEVASRRVAELIEKTVIGTVDGVTYGASGEYLRTSKVYGYRNFPARTTKTNMTAPTASNGTTIVAEILQCIELAYATNFFGPFMLYVSTGYDQYLDNDLKTESDKTVRQRIMEIDAISGVRRLDYLTGNEVLLVQMTADVAEAVSGAEITTVQWDTKGGMQRNFKVLAIQVPRIRSTYLSGATTQVTGIVHGTTS